MGLGTRIEKYLKLERPIVWTNVIGILAINIAMVQTVLYYGVLQKKFVCIAFGFFYGLMGSMAITTGSHRLWAHKTYKAKLPLRIWIMFWYLSSGMYGMVQWVRDHRTHHKYADTDADPHNISRGFFYAHCGWLMMKRHPELKEKGKLIDVSDVLADPVVRFSEKYFYPLVLLCHSIIPIAVGYFILKESLTVCIVVLVMGRYAIALHSVWVLNSWSHFYGYKPYNQNIRATNSVFAAIVTCGEGWHNFHHVFPWDYRIGEYGQGLQYGTKLIDFYAWLGQAYDRKSASEDIIKKVLAKNDQLGHQECPEEENNNSYVVKDAVRKMNGEVKAG